MILSMTGYGTGSAQKDDTAVSVEIRTVNHRFLDLHIRIIDQPFRASLVHSFGSHREWLRLMQLIVQVYL